MQIINLDRLCTTFLRRGPQFEFPKPYWTKLPMRNYNAAFNSIATSRKKCGWNISILAFAFIFADHIVLTLNQVLLTVVIICFGTTGIKIRRYDIDLLANWYLLEVALHYKLPEPQETLKSTVQPTENGQKIHNVS
ncbi:hypothetical protein RF11_01788 [Thelohanellus kitauei]|uniref:Uncharacterized protein n=1 Tax=Thelohanellus kitauei TaxID=669202 RepID=A0A0C2MKK9_THEKT|nr:hypothetical protein RF11_01788 [Thelohanellus kitauei]